MQNLKAIIQKSPSLSIDFDGTLCTPIFNRSWANSKESKNHSLVYKLVELIWMIIIYHFQKPYPFCQMAIKQWKSQDKNIHLNTSRNSLLIYPTTQWLKKNNLLSYFDKLNFNTKQIQGYKQKMNTIISNNIDTHIDDNSFTIYQLAIALPNKNFIYFQKNKTQTPPPPLPNIYHMNSWHQLISDN